MYLGDVEMARMEAVTMVGFSLKLVKTMALEKTGSQPKLMFQKMSILN
jgi:hypothetical protein